MFQDYALSSYALTCALLMYGTCSFRICSGTKPRARLLCEGGSGLGKEGQSSWRHRQEGQAVKSCDKWRNAQTRFLSGAPKQKGDYSSWLGRKRRLEIQACPQDFRLSCLGCDIHTHSPAQKGSTNIILYPFLLRTCSTSPLGHGHGYDCRGPLFAW